MVIRVKIESDALLVCFAHAVSTEKEEVMGLLIGEITDDNIAHVHAVIMLRRSDKRKDRVEISPEQLSSASTQAEAIGLMTRVKQPMRIIGWYHSHPHITVWPSHVDVRTQAMYQMMDKDFVGIIVSCFSDDSAMMLGQVQVTCFQAIDVAGPMDGSEYHRLEIPLEIVPSHTLSEATLTALVELPCILEQVYREVLVSRRRECADEMNHNKALIQVDIIYLGIPEAANRIGLQVFHCQNFQLKLQYNTFLVEEEESYRRTLTRNDQDLITAIHNGTVYTRAICQLMDVICGPLMQSFESKLKTNFEKIEKLKQIKNELEKRVGCSDK